MTKYVEMMLTWFRTSPPANRVILGACMVMASLWLTPFLMSLGTARFTKEWWVEPMGLTGMIVLIIGGIVTVFGILDFSGAQKKEKP